MKKWLFLIPFVFLVACSKHSDNSNGVSYQTAFDGNWQGVQGVQGTANFSGDSLSVKTLILLSTKTGESTIYTVNVNSNSFSGDGIGGFIRGELLTVSVGGEDYIYRRD